MKEVFSVFASEHVISAVSKVAEEYMVHILGKTPKSLPYLHQMEEMLKDYN